MPGPAPSEMLPAFLADRDAPCPCCGYNLRGLNDTRCPECATALSLGIGCARQETVWDAVGRIAVILFCAYCGYTSIWRFKQMLFGPPTSSRRWYDIVWKIDSSMWLL